MPYTCPNSAWCGCTHADKVFKYKTSFEKHVAKCNVARNQSESEEADLRPLMKQVLKRLTELEQQVAVLKLDNKNLRAQLAEPTIRGAYEVRGEGETPDIGFGDWDHQLFLEAIEKADAMYRQKVGHSVFRRNAGEFIAAVCYCMNGETNVVRVKKATRIFKGYPTHVDLNFKKRRRTYTLDCAVKRLFERPFLPSVEEIEGACDTTVPPALAQAYRYYLRNMAFRPDKDDRSKDSYTAKVDLLLTIANYSVPKRERKLTPEERADQLFEAEVEGTGRWWLMPRQWSMQRVVETYDSFLRNSSLYKTALREYFKERPDRRAEYHEAEGTLV